MARRKHVPVLPNIHGGSAGRASNREQIRKSIQAWTQSVIAKEAPDLLTETANVTVTAETIARICEVFSGRSRSDEVRLAHDYLTGLLRKGAENLDWAVEAYPPQLINIPRPPSPFRPESIGKSPILSEIIRRHELSLIDPSVLASLCNVRTAGRKRDKSFSLRCKTLLASELQEAQLLFSAIVNGGLLQPCLLYDLPEALTTQLFTHDDYIWVDFEMTREKEERQLYRRWFPDPITACLILRWRLAGSEWPHRTPGKIRKLISRYLNNLGVEFTFVPIEQTDEVTSTKRSDKFDESVMSVRFAGVDARFLQSRPVFLQASAFEFLLDAAETRLQTFVPSVLVGFARSLRAGASLPPSAWWRTLKDERILNNGGDASNSEALIRAELVDIVEGWPKPPNLASSKTKPSAQIGLFRELRACFRKGNNNVRPSDAVKAVGRLLQDKQHMFGPMLIALTEWVRWCLTERTRGKGTLVARSIRRYLDSIGGRLIDHAGNRNPIDMTADDFRALFDQISGSISSRRERQYARERLNEFHDYLVATFDLEPLGSDYQSDRHATESIPHSNVITETEFKAISSKMQYWVPDLRKQEMLVNITTLAYRLGLRRDEIAGLQLKSIHGIDWTGKTTPRPLVWVHTSSYSSVKSNASIRRLPLDAAFLDEELEQFVNWVKRRYKEVGPASTGSELLFCEQGSPSAKLEDTGNFQLITQAMRDVTGDPSMRFHYFRHSFITLLVARYMAASEPSWIISALPQTWNAKTHLSGPSLLSRMFGCTGPIREAIYQVSMLAGHIDPQETMQTYCHSFDWLLGRYLAYADRPISLKLLAKLDGREDSAVGVARHRRPKINDKIGMADVRQSLTRLIKKAGRLNPNIFAKPPETVVRIRSPAPFEMDKGHNLTDLSLDEVYALTLSGKQKMPGRARAELFQLPVSVIEDFLSEASSMASTPTAMRANNRRRSRFLRHQHNRDDMPRSTKQPEIYSFGPALPRTRVERREGREVFNNVMEAQAKDKNGMRAQLECLLRTGCRSESGFLIANKRDADLLGALLKNTGIGSRRIEISVLSLPRGSSSKAKLSEEIAKLLLVRKSSITFRQGNTRSRNSFGRLLVTVNERSAASSDHTPRAASGWKAACFYALVVLRVVTMPGYQSRLL